MNTNKLTAEQREREEREERANRKRAAIKVLRDVIAVHNNFYSTSIDVIMYAGADDISIEGHGVTDFIAVARLMGLTGYASGYNEVTIY